MRSTTVEPRQEREQASRLSELLACEAELARLMAAAREEGRKRVEAARAETERATAELGAALEAEAERARREIADGYRARVRALLEDARRQVTRFDAVSDQEVAGLAVSALRLLVAPEGPA